MKKLCSLLLALILALGSLSGAAQAAEEDVSNSFSVMDADLLHYYSTEPVSDVDAQWKNFRNSDRNMAVTAARTPRSAAEAELKWASDGGAAYSYGWAMPTAYIMVDGKIITASGDKLSQIDPATGAVEKTVTMAASRGYAYMTPVYGGGMIFAALEGGRIQAFDARTLESRWLYTDPLGGQPLSAITYDDGFLYTGFGNGYGESGERNWVCIPTADEDLSRGDEAKEALWVSPQPGGFYWGGGYVTGDDLVVGGDNGTLYVFDRHTGAVTDAAAADGSIRCSIAAYGENDICFVTQSGSFYTAGIRDGQITGLTKKASLGGASTSTPLVTGGYAYVGVQASWSGPFYIAQIDMDSGAVATVETAAYPQSSLLACTAYDGSTYLYFTCNGNPGGMQVIEVSDDGAMTLSDLYIPDDAMRNYCVASVMCDEEGTLYYANDSGYLFAIGFWEAEHCPVSFRVSPSGAAVEVRGETGEVVLPSHAEVYDLPAGVYTYTVVSGETRKSGTLTVTASYAEHHIPQTVCVALGSGQNTPVPAPETISVSIRVADPKGKTYLKKTAYTARSGDTVYDLLQMTGLRIQSAETPFGVYIQAIEGLGEFDEGSNSGWMYRVNGVYPQTSASMMELEDGDYVEWLYTRSLGEDIGGSANPVTDADKKAAAKAEALIDAIGSVTADSKEAIEAARKAYDALSSAQKKLVTNYDVLVAAEKAYAALERVLPFADVDGHWAQEAIRYVWERGLMQGTGETAFSPEAATSRGMFVTILYRLEGSPAVSGTQAFSDVPGDAYCADAVKWAAASGITGGYDDGSFRPDAPATREQLAVLLYRYAVLKGYSTAAEADLTIFADTDKIAEWSLGAVKWAHAEGLIGGMTDSLLAPGDGATRAQTAMLLMRWLENGAE